MLVEAVDADDGTGDAWVHALQTNLRVMRGKMATATAAKQHPPRRTRRPARTLELTTRG